MSSNHEPFAVNPYIAGSPVKDAAMFFGREDVYAWIRQHLRGKFQDNVIVLYGERRSGKTSVLYQMKHQLGDDRYIPVLLDLQGMDLEGMDGFLWGIARKIVVSLRGVEGVPLLDRPSRRDFEGNARDYLEHTFIPPVIAALGERRLLLMFDETDRLEEKVRAGDLPSDAFDYLRSVVQSANRLNFLFSLGSRVEEARESSQLFNLAVYRKISFLDHDYAEDLINKPIAEYYAYTRPAIERIIDLTSGQPYYTQLVCHNLFTRWSRDRRDQLDVPDVEAVLPDVVEQGTPNLQFVWDDSSPSQRAILAALADRAPQYRAGVMRRNVTGALRRNGLYPPDNDVTRGLKRLFERDIINNQEPYEFRVDLMQQWLTEYKRLDWVGEELSEVAQEWERLEQKRLAEAPTAAERARKWAAPIMGGLLLGVLIVTVLLWRNLKESEELSSAALNAAEARRSTEVAELQATIIAAGTLVAEAGSAENSQQIAEIRATARAAEAIAEIALARVTEVAQKEATAQAAASTSEALAEEGQVVAAAEAQVTAIAAQAEAVALENTLTPTAAPIPTDTPSPTPAPTATPRPTNTPTLAMRGRLAIPVFNGERYDVNIYSVVDGSLLGTIPSARQPSFRRSDGKLIVNGEESRAIWIYDPDGTNGRSISVDVGDSHPSWNPNGLGLVYDNSQKYLRDGKFVWSIYIQDALGDSLASSADRLAGDILDASGPLYPFWTADGKIIFRACDYWSGGGRCGIWRTDSTATLSNRGFRLPENVTSQQEIPTDVRGNRLIAMGRPAGNWDVLLGSLDDGSLQNLSNHPADDGLGTLSPDGRWVAFLSTRDGTWGAWVMLVSGGEATRLPIENLRFGNGERNWPTERISWGP
ncbi:MAG TPA: AAA family ATPase [Anaerolineae bacterium]